MKIRICGGTYQTGIVRRLVPYIMHQDKKGFVDSLFPRRSTEGLHLTGVALKRLNWSHQYEYAILLTPFLTVFMIRIRV